MFPAIEVEGVEIIEKDGRAVQDLRGDEEFLGGSRLDDEFDALVRAL